MNIDQYTLRSNTNLHFFMTMNIIAFTSYMFIPQYLFYISVAILLLDLFMVIRKFDYIFKLNLSSLLLLLFVFLSFFGLFNGGDTPGDNQYFFSIAALTLNYIILISEVNWSDSLISGITVSSIFFMVGSILQLISSDLINLINKVHLSSENYISSLKFVSNGALVGFTHNPGVNGYMISILLLLIFIRSFFIKTTNKKILNYIYFIFVYYLLVLTGKRGFLLFTIIIILYLLVRLYKQKIKIILPIIIVLLIFYFLITYTEMGNLIISRTMDSDSITTGRWPVYKIMWEDFLEKPIFGNGTYSTLNAIYLFNGHNIYLQILRENGIIGFLTFLSVLGINLIGTDRHLKNAITNRHRAALSISICLQFLFIFWGITGNPLYDIYPFCAYIFGIALYWINRQEILDYNKVWEEV